MEDDSDLLIVACGIIIAGSLQRKRSCWIRPSLLSRNCYSNQDRLRDLKADDLIVQNPIHFKTFMKLTNTDFEYLLNIVGPRIVKKDTNCRISISPQDRLSITLKYLSTGDSFLSLCHVFKVSPQIISYIIPEVCQAIIDGLSDYVKIPRISNEWEKVADRYLDRWNVPNCLGSMDGKHIKIQCPPRSGSEYYNYKTYFSIVLFALVDADYRFLYANVGCQGRISDGGVFNNSALSRMLNNNSLNLPNNKPLPGRNVPVPYFFLGDDAFALQTHIVKPYDGNHAKRSPKRIFNYRICRGRRVVENVFGQLTSKFQIFKRPIQLCPQKSAIVTLACIYLFNYIKRDNTIQRNEYDSENDDGEIIPGEWRTVTPENNCFVSLPRGVNITLCPEDTRNELVEYFLSDIGSLEWQYDQ